MSVSKIGRISTLGVITESPVLARSLLFGISAGTGGAMWFTDYGGNKIGAISAR